MKNKKLIKNILIYLLIVGAYYYLVLPPINLKSPLFWFTIVLMLALFVMLFGLSELLDFFKSGNNFEQRKSIFKTYKLIPKIFLAAVVIIGLIFLINLIISPFFMSSQYANRIQVDESGIFEEDVSQVDFSKIALLDKDSSKNLGDRTMGQMPELVSQYDVSSVYTQIMFRNQIERVTPLEYDDLIKSFTNRKEGITGYIRVDSVTGKSTLERLDKGIKYAYSAPLGRNLDRKLRFSYPFDIFGNFTFEIDDDKNPFWIVPVLKYKGIGKMEDVSHVIIFNPIDGSSEKYAVEDVPSWVDNVYNPFLVLEQLDHWGKYRHGFFNATIGQKNVVTTTEGYNYLIQDDGIYLTTGITSRGRDESNIGFILTNLRTKETKLYKVPGAEEYSAMDSARGQVQQMNYVPTFPILVNLNNKPTYIISLKDNAGLVKMYAFVDLEDYQKVSVTEVSKGIEYGAEVYLKSNPNLSFDDELHTREIEIKSFNQTVVDALTFYYIQDTEGLKYKVSIKVNDVILPFVNIGDKLLVSYKEGFINEIVDVSLVD